MDYFWSKRFLVALASLAILCGLSGCTYDLVVRAGYANPNGVYSAVEGPAAAGSSDAGAPVDGGHRLGSNANYAYAVGFGANNVAWSTAYATPEISVATPTSDVATVPLLIQSQAPWASATGTNRNPGSINFNIPSIVAGGTRQSFNFQSGGTTFLTITPDATPSAAISAPSGNLTLQSTSGDSLVLSTDNFTLRNSAGSTNWMTATTSLISFGRPVGGLGTTPLAFSGQTSPNTVACGTGGTQTISAAQAIIPFFLLTATNPLTSNCVIDFSTNASTGWFTLDVTGALAIGAGGFTIGFKNGSKTQTFNLSQLTAFAATGMTSMTVKTYGTNLITVGGG